MKRKLTKLLLSIVLSLFFLITNTAKPIFAVATYSKAYSIENVMTDFQYFIQGDLTGSGHTVGAVAVGGTFDKSNTISDGQITPSYIYDVKNCSLGTGNYYDGDKTVYYGTNSTGAALDPKFVQNSDYINMTSAFSSLVTDSVAKASAATKTYTASDIDNSGSIVWGASVLKVDVTNKNISIPWDVFSQIDVISMTGYGNADYFKTNSVYISVTNVPSDKIVDIIFGYGTYGGDGKAYIFWGDQAPDSFIKNMTGGTNGNEINLEGMKLVWNVPDAKTVNVSSLSGHLVAPNADVTIHDCGRFEGGVIAKKLVSGGAAEAHFYTYFDPTSSGGSTYSATFIKQNESSESLSGAVFKLFNTYDDAVSATNSTVSLDTQVSDTTGKVIFNGLSASTDYFMKEVNAPTGYSLNDKVYKISISADGTSAFYPMTNSNTSGAEISPAIIVNTAVPVLNTSISFTKISSETPSVALEGALFGLYSDANCNTAIIDAGGENYTSTSDNSGVVKFNNLTAGTYYFKELIAPEGYVLTDNIYSVIISFDGSGAASVTFGDGTQTGLNSLSVLNDPITGTGDTDDSGDDSGDNSGDDSGDNSGDNSGDDSGDDSGDNSGDNSGDDSGSDNDDNDDSEILDNSNSTIDSQVDSDDLAVGDKDTSNVDSDNPNTGYTLSAALCAILISGTSLIIFKKSKK